MEGVKQFLSFTRPRPKVGEKLVFNFRSKECTNKSHKTNEG